MTLYLVFRQGVYRHECLGAYADRATALERADGVAAAEKDAYNDIDVYEIPADLDVQDCGPCVYSAKRGV